MRPSLYLFPFILLLGCDAQRAPMEMGTLHPAATTDSPVAFYQSIPLPKGETRLTQPVVSLTDDSGNVAAVARAANYWPDGSVQWMRVEGTVQGGVKAGQPIALRPGRAATVETPRRAALEIQEDGVIRWTEALSGKTYRLVPEASLVAIRKEKPEPPTDPHWLDREGQYAWAMPLEALNSGEAPIALKLRTRHQKVEEENAIYRVVCIQGDGGETAPGRGLEWQLRVKLFHDLALIRTEMTWIAQWDVRQYALASAKWSVVSESAWSGFAPMNGSPASQLVITNNPRGEGTVNGVPQDAPVVERDGLVALSAEGKHLAVGVANFSRLGPNHLWGEGDRVEIASWSERSGRALDLRRSTSRKDYGTSGVDFKWDGRGVSRTLYVSLALSDRVEEAQALARHEAARDYLWFADAEELCRSRALGPYSLAAITANPEMMSGMQANLHFLRASRDHWRWTGWANFGDIRTNFAKGDVPARGLHAGHWVLHGRYGWRNASGTISTGFIQTGILLNDRALILAGVDNAEHIADVDAFHGSLFADDTGDQGGFHRRNRDHWSGDVQGQYSPNAGIYLTQWLTGGGRLRDALVGLRGYASRHAPNHSVFPAQAWLMHYRETRDPAALTEANRLLNASAAWYEERNAVPGLSGIASIYGGNFRRITDGMWTLELFHQATDDPLYLKAMEASARAHPLEGDKRVSGEGRAYLLAYLRSQGITDLPNEAEIRHAFAEITPPLIDSPATADYATLEQTILEKLPPAGSPGYRESAAIAHRATYLPVILEQFGKQANP